MPHISICIPVYNFLIEPLIAKLSNEISIGSIDAEIVVIDDASNISFRNMNYALTEKYPINYIQLQKNIGRAPIRNLFANYIKSSLLLFLDCDVMPAGNKFISSYLSSADKNKMVICGGIIYSDKPPSIKNKLHWKFGYMREALPASKRSKQPYRYFLTSNFLIHKEIFGRISFNEALKGYGYEDTLYGIELEQNKIELKHIDLPAEHLKIDTAEEFILKTENALKNLYRLYRSDEYRSALKCHIKLIKIYNILTTFQLKALAILMHNLFGNNVRDKLINGNTNLLLLDLYKLLFFVSLQKEEEFKPY